MPKKIQIAKPIRWAFQKKDELGVKMLILIGGRGSTKSTAASDVVLAKAQSGQRWCCAREFLNSIEDSCQALLSEEIDRLEFEGFTETGKGFNHVSKGQIFHKGLARNPASIKSIVADGIWIEEGETLSAKTLDVMATSFRISAAKRAKAKREGKEAKIPDIIITMNRGNSKDPISTHYLKPADHDIKRQGWYADEDVLIVQVNYTDIPNSWFVGSGLEAERQRDLRLMPKSEYEWKWLGGYNDKVENAIILPEWVDACKDAHERLGFRPEGQEKVSFDPADVGKDPEALAYSHGSVILQAMSNDQKSIDDACDWATDYANQVQADVFTWDCDGMGVGLKRQVSDAFKGKKVTTDQFKGSEGPLHPNSVYEPLEGEQAKPKANKDAFLNQRAQWYFLLRKRIFNTYQVVKAMEDGKAKYINPEELISFSSGILHWDLLRAELCSIPRKLTGGSGKFQLLSKADMLRQEIASPNVADCVMMLMKQVDIAEEITTIPYRGWA